MKEKYCAGCRRWLAKTEFNRDRSSADGLNRRCAPCARTYHRERRIKLKDEEVPKLDAAIYAQVSSDPLWQVWLNIPPRAELDAQHPLAVQLQRRYRCCYYSLSHSMREAWINHWTERNGGAAPYANVYPVAEEKAHIAPRPCEWNGAQYDSMAAAAREAGLSTNKLRYWLERGCTSNADITRFKSGQRTVQS